jgi:hypothetical protein
LKERSATLRHVETTSGTQPAILKRDGDSPKAPMSTKSIRVDRPESHTSEPHTPPNHTRWSTRVRVILATLALLATGYVVWQIFRAEPPIPIPDTPILPVPAP